MVGARRSLIPDIKPKDNRNMMKIKISLVIILDNKLPISRCRPGFRGGQL